MSAHPWPSMAGWLPDDLPQLNKAIIFRAFSDAGICEVPMSSNRSGRIDEYNQRAGVPLGSYWCMSWATAVWEDCGAKIPSSGRASCDIVMEWAKQNGLWHQEPVIGALVLYGVPGNAEHTGIVIRTSPVRRSLEGNAGVAGGVTRNGEGVEMKVVAANRVLGFAHPVKAAA